MGGSMIEISDAPRPSSGMFLQPMPTAVYPYGPDAGAV